MCPCARVHVCSTNNLGFSVWYYVPPTCVPGVSSYLVSARYQPATKIRVCIYVCARVGYVLCATYVRKRSKAHSNEYHNNIHKAQQALPAWRGAGRSSRDTKPLLSRCCPAATVPAAVVFACGFPCCFAAIAKKKKNHLAITLILLLKLLQNNTI